METMQFRDFVFRHNPRTIVVQCPNQVVSHFVPGQGERVRCLGPRARTVRCEGSFFGTTPEDSMQQLAQFRAAAAPSEAGLLFVPGLEPFSAHLKELAFDAQGDGRILSYTITFVEERP